MPTNLNTINQADIAALLKERLEQPDLYVDRPLIIWRSDFGDGIQTSLLRYVLKEYNETKPLEDRKWYRQPIAGDISHVAHELTEGVISGEEVPKVSHLGLYVLSPMDHGMDKSSINGCIEALTARRFNGQKMLPGIPLVAYMCNNRDRFETSDAYPGAEQYVFEPDFEQWCQHIEKNGGSIKKVIDFIKGYESTEGISYCWYNYFNNTDAVHRAGCDFPECWYEAMKRLKFQLKIKRLKRFFEIPEDDFKIAFPHGISKDIADKFYIYVKERNL